MIVKVCIIENLNNKDNVLLISYYALMSYTIRDFKFFL